MKTNRRLTPRQHHVLSVLVTRGECARNDAMAWYPLYTEQIYGIMDRLGRRGFVEPVRFEDNARLFGITQAGLDALRAYDGETIEDEDEE